MCVVCVVWCVVCVCGECVWCVWYVVFQYLVCYLPSQPLHHSEPLRIADWLALYKLQDYVPLFEANGYDHTDILVGISQEVRLHKPSQGREMIVGGLVLCPGTGGAWCSEGRTQEEDPCSTHKHNCTRPPLQYETSKGLAD